MIELIIMVFLISLTCGFIVRKVTRDRTLREVQEDAVREQQKRGNIERTSTIEGTKHIRHNAYNDYDEDAEYDSDGRRIR